MNALKINVIVIKPLNIVMNVMEVLVLLVVLTLVLLTVVKQNSKY